MSMNTCSSSGVIPILLRIRLCTRVKFLGFTLLIEYPEPTSVSIAWLLASVPYPMIVRVPPLFFMRDIAPFIPLIVVPYPYLAPRYGKVTNGICVKLTRPPDTFIPSVMLNPMPVKALEVLLRSGIGPSLTVLRKELSNSFLSMRLPPLSFISFSTLLSACCIFALYFMFTDCRIRDLERSAIAFIESSL